MVIESSIIHCVIVSIFSGFMYGYNTAIVAGISKPALEGFFNATFYDPEKKTCVKIKDHPGVMVETTSESNMAAFEGLFVSDILVGMLLGAFVGPVLAKAKGRRIGMICISLLATICPLLMGLINNFVIQVLLRFILGIAIGAVATICPMFVTEMAPPAKRGTLGVIFQANICLSIFVAETINYTFNPNNLGCFEPLSWMLQFGFGVFPGGLSLLYTIFFMPESDGWLTDKLLNDDDVKNNYGMMDTIDETGLSQGNGMNRAGGYKLLCSRKGFKWLIICIGLPLCQQMTGINAVMFYGPQIFQGQHMSNPLLIDMFVVGLWNTLAVGISIYLIDRLGRRVLMLGGLGAMLVACILMGINANMDLTSPILPVLAMMIYLAGFETGPGPLFFLMASEAFPQDVRNEGLALSNFLCNAMNIFTSFMFPLLKGAMGIGNVFFFYGFMSLIGAAFVYFLLPETKATEKEDIRKNVDGMDYNKLMVSEADDFMDSDNRPLKTPAGVRWTPAYGDKKTVF